MNKESKQKKNYTQKWFEKIFSSRWFGLLCLILTIVFSAIASKMDGNWIWIIATFIILGIILGLMYFLSFLMRKEREDIIQNIIQEDGVLHYYLQQQVKEFSESGNCLLDVQKECRKRIQQNFFKTTEDVKFFDVEEILKLEKDLVKNSEIWIITDELGTEVDNADVFNAIVSNLNDGTIYKYFYTKKENSSDAISRIKSALQRIGMRNVDEKISFRHVGNKYDALLSITKDVIILNPDGQKNERRAFICIYSKNNFEIAFYRELESKEIEPLCSIIRDYMLRGVKSSI